LRNKKIQNGCGDYATFFVVITPHFQIPGFWLKNSQFGNPGLNLAMKPWQAHA